ncbi:tetratricopeptide repeat protein [Chryseosolibacter indicus]|uniref:Tetratricopeptide repeat protein n=1 Tax=Chryseosolibacter indicus TaxID=2782351 RepID=A0ABS5VMJ1_9BACT|nr:tetratricopeptide repeat protein [Chryseosolibacter indicus]MBT1702672.1 tetratricopeptide repeat protein [Chryseosolibacter indicus]
MKNQVFLFSITIILFTAACSSQRNTWTSKAFHNTTAHYNGYFYAKGEIEKVEKTIRNAQIDDYNRVLWLFPTFDSSMAKGYDKEIQEAIKMASIAIQRHPNSKWVDDAYILVGKGRHYSLDWGNAIQAFKYTNTISKDVDTKHLAIINLIRTYIEHKEFNNAKAAIDFLLKEDLNKSNKKKLYLERAYYYQIHDDYDNMVRNLTQASPMLKKSDRRGRIYFIIGQVYQRLGFEAEAYNFYKKCISTNPEYEVDFYARLYMAQVTEISKTKDVNAARKTFKKLLKDSKNREFKDKIYYEMGVFELKQQNVKEAISDFNKSIKEGKNKRIDGEAYLRLGEVYYDTLKNYELSQAYYDSAINSLPQDFENYDAIKARADILNEFVDHIKTIKWQDSLLTLSTVDSASIKARIDEIVAEKKKVEEIAAKKRKKNRIEISTNDNNNIFASNEEGETGITSSNDWYFSSPSTMSMGQSEFTRVWGNIPLEDNWRRSLKETGPAQANANVSSGDSLRVTAQQGGNTPEKKAIDPAVQEFERLNKEIPRTEEAKKEALAKIEEAYFKLGEIYHFKLLENDNAVITYKTLLQRFPNTEHEPEVLYTLYLILKGANPQQADAYASTLKEKHPNSTFAKILVNPAYLQESSQTAEKQKELYQLAYHHFEADSFHLSSNVLQEAMNLGETNFTPTLELLRVLIIGKTETIYKYQFELDQFITKYSEAEIVNYAKKLLETSKRFQESEEKRKGIQYIRSLEEHHYFVVVHKRKDKAEDIFTNRLKLFNEQHFSEINLKISNLILNDDYAVTFVSEFSNVSTAIRYFITFNENLPTLNDLGNQKFDNFVITKDNFDIFYRTKGLDEYLRFFEKNYPKENQ